RSRQPVVRSETEEAPGSDLAFEKSRESKVESRRQASGTGFVTFNFKLSTLDFFPCCMDGAIRQNLITERRLFRRAPLFSTRFSTDLLKSRVRRSKRERRNAKLERQGSWRDGRFDATSLIDHSRRASYEFRVSNFEFRFSVSNRHRPSAMQPLTASAGL